MNESLDSVNMNDPLLQLILDKTVTIDELPLPDSDEAVRMYHFIRALAAERDALKTEVKLLRARYDHSLLPVILITRMSAVNVD